MFGKHVRFYLCAALSFPSCHSLPSAALHFQCSLCSARMKPAISISISLLELHAYEYCLACVKPPSRLCDVISSAPSPHPHPLQQILKMLQACHEQPSPFPNPSFQFSYNPTPRLVHTLLPTLTQSLRVLHHFQRYPSNLKKSIYIVGDR